MAVLGDGAESGSVRWAVAVAWLAVWCGGGGSAMYHSTHNEHMRQYAIVWACGFDVWWW